MWILNPPRSRKRHKKAARSKRRSTSGRRRKPMASRTRRRRAGRSRSGRFVKGHRSARRRHRRARPAARRRRRRSHARRARVSIRVNPRRRRRAHSRRRTRRNPRFGVHRPRVRYTRRGFKSRGMLHGYRVNPRRRRRSYSRRRRTVGNPFALPSLSSAKGVLTAGAAGLVGWVGVNAVMMIADKVGLATFKASQSPTVGALINAAVRTVATPVVAKLAAKFLKLPMSAVMVGGGINVVLHGVQDLIAANPTMLPDAAKPLLLGYDGFGDFATIATLGGARPAMNGYATVRNLAQARALSGFGAASHAYGGAVDGRINGRVFA